MATTPTEEIIALMPTLTISQQCALAKKARDFANQNRSKPQATDESPKRSTGEAAAVSTAKISGRSSDTPEISEEKPRFGRCQKCGCEYTVETLQKHQRKCKNKGKWIKVPPHEKERTFSKGEYSEGGRVFQGGLCGRR